MIERSIGKNMVILMEENIFDGHGIIHPMFIKRNLIIALKESAFCVVEESENDIDCTKNRYGNRTMETYRDYDFDKVKLSELNGTVTEVHIKYFGKNIWLLLDQ